MAQTPDGKGHVGKPSVWFLQEDNRRPYNIETSLKLQQISLKYIIEILQTITLNQLSRGGGGGGARSAPLLYLQNTFLLSLTWAAPPLPKFPDLSLISLLYSCYV